MSRGTTAVPLPVLDRYLVTSASLLGEAGCPEAALRIACLPFSQRFPHDHGVVSLETGALHSDRVVRSLLRFQQLGTRLLRTGCGR